MEIVLLQSAQSDLLEILAREGDGMYGVLDATLEKILFSRQTIEANFWAMKNQIRMP